MIYEKRLENDLQTGTMLLIYIAMTLTNHLKTFLGPLSLSLIDIHH